MRLPLLIILAIASNPAYASDIQAQLETSLAQNQELIVLLSRQSAVIADFQRASGQYNMEAIEPSLLTSLSNLNALHVANTKKLERHLANLQQALDQESARRAQAEKALNEARALVKTPSSSKLTLLMKRNAEEDAELSSAKGEIKRLTERNTLLTRQLDEARHENSKKEEKLTLLSKDISDLRKIYSEMPKKK